MRQTLEMLERGGYYRFSRPIKADEGIFESGTFIAFVELGKNDALLLFLSREKNGEKSFGVTASYLNKEHVDLHFYGSSKHAGRTRH